MVNLEMTRMNWHRARPTPSPPQNITHLKAPRGSLKSALNQGLKSVKAVWEDYTHFLP